MRTVSRRGHYVHRRLRNERFIRAVDAFINDLEEAGQLGLTGSFVHGMKILYKYITGQGRRLNNTVSRADDTNDIILWNDITDLYGINVVKIINELRKGDFGILLTLCLEYYSRR